MAESKYHRRYAEEGIIREESFEEVSMSDADEDILVESEVLDDAEVEVEVVEDVPVRDVPQPKKAKKVESSPPPKPSTGPVYGRSPNGQLRKL